MREKITLLFLALLMVVGANAQTTLRKTWDFRNGFSTMTVNALKADQEEFGDTKYWRNYEGDATKADQQHFWCASKDAKNADGYACTHNGGQEKVIPELDGLMLGFTAAKKFVITYNGAQAANEFESEGGPAIGEMIPHGKSYLWLNGKNETIKFKAEVGQTIKIAVESHAVNKSKLGEARGISLTAEGGTLTAKFEGNPVPTYYTEYEWELTGDAGNIATLTIKSTNGCHIYYIIVGEGDDPNANKTQVAYLAAGDAASEPAFAALQGISTLNVTAVDAASVTVDQLKQNTVTVISPSLPSDHAAVNVVKQALAFTPILNLNAGLYAAWGYGEAAASMPLAVIGDLKSDLFAGFSADEGDYLEVDGVNAIQLGNDNAMGIQLGDYFASDPILASDYEGQMALIHVHNIYHNAYLYIPAEAVGVASQKLFSNAVELLKSSKSEITKAAAPKITLDYKNLSTNITMAMASSNMPKPHIYYTLDGSDPTEASQEYTEMISVSSACKVKAVAIAEGYLLSDVAYADAEIFSQPATPTVNCQYNEGATVVTLACETPDVDIWYNYNETNDTTKSMKYTEPLTLKAPASLTAFAVAGGQVFSELASQRVVVKNAVVRIDKIGVFDANAADYQNGGGSTVYFFSWGKNASSIYDTTQEGTTTTDPDTGDEITIYPEKDYSYYVPLDENGNAKDWEVKSKGQVMIWQSLTVGKDPGNDGGYNPETSADILTYAEITNNDIQFGGKTSGEPCTGAIQSRVRYAGPFDVVTYVGTAAGGDNVGRMQLEVSTDSINWTPLGDEMTTSTVKRLWKGYVRSYNGTDEVYVRIVQAGGGSSVQIYNMYILNAGEQSLTLKAQYDEEFANAGTGIVDTRKASVTSPKGIYNLNGVRLQKMNRGINIVVQGDGTVKKVLVK